MVIMPCIDMENSQVMKKLLDAFLGRSSSVNPNYWHRWHTILPVYLTDGSTSYINADVWRQRTAKGVGI
jgi:hypothetical protein